MKNILVYRVTNADGRTWYTIKKPDNYYEKEEKCMTLKAFSELDILLVYYRDILRELANK